MRIKRKIILKAILVAIFGMSVWGLNAETLQASHKNSALVFSGEHAGMKFSGKFESWQSTLILPPAESPSITATFDLSSAKTGDWTYDSTLPEADWFNTDQHPEGVFTSNAIKATETGFTIKGELTLKGITAPVTFDLEGAIGSGFKANITLDRLTYDIGVESDPDAEWVSREINLELSINR